VKNSQKEDIYSSDNDTQISAAASTNSSKNKENKSLNKKKVATKGKNPVKKPVNTLKFQKAPLISNESML
jgi:hypothetical protein